MNGNHLNIRIKFQKYGAMKFVGHLDIMRYFQKAIRRAGIPIAYSEGYSPHQLMSFAAPLSVGLTSDGEYFDITVNALSFGEDDIQKLGQAMAEGISILGYQVLPDAVKPSMSLVAAADYLAYVKPEYRGGDVGTVFQDYSLLQDKVLAFYQGQGHIPFTKQTKKNTVEMDLKQLIYQMKPLSLREEDAVKALPLKNPEILSFLPKEAAGQQDPPCGNMLFLRLCTGSSNNLKPELVLEAFCKSCGAAYHPFCFQIHRLEVYAKADEIPVKGEQARQEYLEYLEGVKQDFKRAGKAFPEFIALGASL